MHYLPDMQVALRRFAQDEGQADHAMAMDTDRVRDSLLKSPNSISMTRVYTGYLVVRRRGVSPRRVAHQQRGLARQTGLVPVSADTKIVASRSKVERLTRS